MSPRFTATRELLRHTFSERREAFERLADRLLVALGSRDTAVIRTAFHDLSAATERRIVWEQGTIVPALAEHRAAAEAGCLAHVENDHLVLLRLLDAFGNWLSGLPSTLDDATATAGIRHFERLRGMLRFHERREADFTYPALLAQLPIERVEALAETFQQHTPTLRAVAHAA